MLPMFSLPTGCAWWQLVGPSEVVHVANAPQSNHVIHFGNAIGPKLADILPTWLKLPELCINEVARGTFHAPFLAGFLTGL